MKNSLWNVLSLLIFMSIIAVIAVFAIIFLNPYSQLNPFPPPTVPAALILPSITPTIPEFPVTWTPGAAQPIASGPTLRATSTPLAQSTGGNYIVLVSRAPHHIPSRTPTRTPTKLVETPNLTNTALAEFATDVRVTALARTATYQAGTGATQTVVALPSNPTSVVEIGGAHTNTWQSAISDPSFTWSGVTGALGYYVYWGPDSNGTSSTLIGLPAFDPPAASIGTYYLRLRTVFPWMAYPDWTTVFIFNFDNSLPSLPAGGAEIHGIPDGYWQKTVPDPSFTWNASSDNGSGVLGYDVYFGTNVNGSIPVASPSTPAYDPPMLSTNTYYLRVRSVDRAGNKSDWASLFTFRLDLTAPSVPVNLSTTDPASSATPLFTWSASTDQHSGQAAYEIFWGAGTTCADKNQPDTTGTSFTAPAITDPGDYHLCVRALDVVGNVSNWAEASFTYTPNP